MTVTVAPSLARRRLGRMLRRLRREANLTHEDVRADGIGSRSKMSLIEAGRSKVKKADIYALSALYQLAPEQTQQLLAMAAAAEDIHYSGSLPGSSPAGFDVIDEDLLSVAAVVRVYAPQMVPALVQTEDYARAVLGAEDGLSPGEVEARVSEQQRRQRVFCRRSPSAGLDMVLTPGALNLGPVPVMAAQRDYLRSLDADGQVNVRVLGDVERLQVPRCGEFTLLEFDDPQDPPLVYVASLVDSRYLERAEQVTAYRQAFATLTRLSVPLKDYP